MSEEFLNELEDMFVNGVPLWRKVNLTIEEAAKLSNIGINRIDELLKEPGCPFLVQVGRKKLVHRESFEKYLSKHRFY